MTAFRFADVHFAYGEAPVLTGVTLGVAPGERIALLGRNGAGKTTLTRLLVGLLHPDAGTVWVGEQTTQGKAPEDLSDRIAYVFQHPDQQLFARSVLDEVAFGPRQAGLARADAREIAERALARLGLQDVGQAHPYDLPPALRKLVTVAAAVAQGPEILVLDEPTQGFDRETRGRVGDLILELAGEGVAVFAVSHDLTLVAEAFERVVVLADGMVVADELTADVILNRDRVSALGLVQPPSARLSIELALPGRPVSERDVVRAVRAGRERRGDLRLGRDV